MRNFEIILSATFQQRQNSTHLAALEKAELFKATMEQRIVPIDQQLSYARAETIRKKREKIKLIAQTIIFCGRQRIALRGHQDDWKHLAETPHANPGNFIALLRFRAERGDQVLADNLGLLPILQCTQTKPFKM